MITFENTLSRGIKDAPVGFSWTCLFFGIFVPLFRGDYKWFFGSWLLAIVTFGFSWLVVPFIYNKQYIKGLIGKGFKVRAVKNGDIEFYEKKLGMMLPRVDSYGVHTL